MIILLCQKSKKMTQKKFLQILGITLILTSCIATEKAERRIKLSVSGGYNTGGIVENTDLSLVPNIANVSETNVDAFTGATKGGANAGLHVNKPLRYGEIETGIIYMYNQQLFIYSDYENRFVGTRKINVNQVMLPVSYNFSLLKSILPNYDIQLKLGFLRQRNFIDVTDNEIISLPDYSIKKWTAGAIMGFSVNPFLFSDGSKLGLYFDLYRGTSMYNDFYNQEDFEMPGSAFLKIGLRYQFKNN